MSGRDVKRVSLEDIQLVQNLIERCLQLYMSRDEVINALFDQAKIEPRFTVLVWQKLESENREFFKAYHLRLIVKEQILQFNQLLEQQIELMQQICPTGASPIPLTDRSQLRPIYEVSRSIGSSVKQELSVLPDTYTNGALSQQPCINAAMMHGMNGIGDGSIPRFDGADSGSHPFNNTIPEPDMDGFDLSALIAYFSDCRG